MSTDRGGFDGLDAEMATPAAGAQPPAPVREFDAAPESVTDAEPGGEALPRAARPENVPEKFWDPTKGEIRTDALLKSYAELERRLGRPRAGDVPGSPDDYRINLESPLLHDDPDMPAIRGRLHAAGFTNEQAQLVYDLAAERLEPLVAELAAVSEAERETERLVQRFGGAEPWQQVSRQLSAWGRKALPAPVFDALCTSYEGVVAMHRMMVNEEPALVQDGATMASPVSEAGLKVLMRDPRYWRDHDPAVVAQVREGFRALYPE